MPKNNIFFFKNINKERRERSEEGSPKIFFRLPWQVGRIGPPRDENVALRGEARIPGGQEKSPVSENSLEAVNRSCATNYRRLRAGKSLVIFLLAAAS
ncbi:hypothetical protein TNCV_1164221 [Trichonephila clavipes]|nr:hypothetical protein TNCV_1164221 [Trichonephila clavipes]